jgi:hypothetical protein
MFILEFKLPYTYPMVTINLPNTPIVTNVGALVQTTDGIDDKTDKSSDGASFTLITQGRKARTPTPKTKFTEVTKTKFPAFQQIIFPIVEKILKTNATISNGRPCKPMTR